MLQSCRYRSDHRVRRGIFTIFLLAAESLLLKGVYMNTRNIWLVTTKIGNTDRYVLLHRAELY